MRIFAFVALSFALVAVALAAKKDSKEGDKKEDYGTVVGIDLGTTYSV
jgi:hypothetical protein